MTGWFERNCGTPTEIGSFEAKTKFSEILRRVEQGERFTVTRRGKVVAEINPSAPNTHTVPHDVIERLMNPKIHGISGEEVRAAIEHGRR